MANSIALASKYLPLLDEVYKQASLTAILEKPDFIGDWVNANQVNVLKVAVQGLANYSRNGGYVTGDVTAAWEALTLTKDRGRKFNVDAMDNEETLLKTFAAVINEFLRTKVVPEIDAFRFAAMASMSGIQTVAGATLTSSTVVAAVDAANTALDDAEVSSNNRLFYCTPAIYQALKESDAVTRFASLGEGINRNFDVFDNMKVIKVPQTRFYTAIDLYDGTTTGQEAGGYIKNASAKDINFMIVDPAAVLPIAKHKKPRIFLADVNQDADANSFDYRIYHDMFVYENKVKGVYLHKKA